MVLERLATVVARVVVRVSDCGGGGGGKGMFSGKIDNSPATVVVTVADIHRRQLLLHRGAIQITRSRLRRNSRLTVLIPATVTVPGPTRT